MKTRMGIFALNSKDGSLKFLSAHESQSEIDSVMYDHPEKDLVLLPVVTPPKKERPASQVSAIDAAAEKAAEKVLKALEEQQSKTPVK